MKGKEWIEVKHINLAQWKKIHEIQMKNSSDDDNDDDDVSSANTMTEQPALK